MRFVSLAPFAVFVQDGADLVTSSAKLRCIYVSVPARLAVCTGEESDMGKPNLRALSQYSSLHLTLRGRLQPNTPVWITLGASTYWLLPFAL